MLCSIATKLDDGQLEEIATLERDLGTTLLAFSCLPLDPDALSDEGLERVRTLEGRLGISLVAVSQTS